MKYFLVNRQRQSAILLLSWLVWILFVAGIAHSEQLPIKVYTTADGLAGDIVLRIVRDSRGFLWFCTDEGLSRFEGYQFTRYTTDQGLPSRSVTDFLETRQGSYWVATRGGVCRFNLIGAPLFTVYYPGEDEASRRVVALAEDHDGVIWCGTDGGLYRLEETQGQAQFQFVDMAMPDESGFRVIQNILVDRAGALWVGTAFGGLYRRRPDGRVEHYTKANGLLDKRVEAVLEDSSGQLWVGQPGGLCQIVREPDPARPAVARVYTARDGLLGNWVASLFQSSDGKLWAGSNGSLSEFVPSAGGPSRPGVGPQFRTYTTQNGLSSHYITGMAEDRDGNLWIGTDSGGAMKLARSGFTTFTEADGLAAPGVDAVLEDRAGELYAISAGPGKHFINRFDSRRFTFVWPDLPKRITDFGWGYNQVTFQDHTGEWWVPTAQGLCRFPAVSRMEQLATTPPKAVYTTREGLPSNDVFRLYEDSRGDIWISTVNQWLTRIERATGKLHTFSEAEGYFGAMGPLDAFAEDAAGNLWIGFWSGGLARYAGGRFTAFTEADGLPAGMIRSLYLDHGHRLWIAASLGGLARIDDPTAASPRFVTYTTAEGLSSNDVWCMTEDRQGNLYVGTGRGLDRLDGETGHVQHYTAADGLMRGKVTTAFRDRHGVLWFASNVHGLSRFVPGPDLPPTPPPIVISGLRIAGEAYPLSLAGVTEGPHLELGPSQNRLNIDFVGVSFAAGEVLRYQYLLEGADQDWSHPGEQRSVNYANLAPGRYRFLVRAVNAEGLASTEPATFAFTIAPPFWRRWWFALALFSGVVAAAYSLHRARLRQVVAMEKVRRQVATDLHDEVGSGLAQIAILSEVAKRQPERAAPGLLSEVADLARVMRESMSDIVWAVDPRKDSLAELVQRMRQVTFNLLEVEGIPVEFDAPGEAECARINLAPDRRRHLHLLFKEAVTNIARHAEARRVHIYLRSESGGLRLSIADDGRGFDPHKLHSGHGLGSLRQRAAELHGHLEIESSPGCGTLVRLTIPLR